MLAVGMWKGYNLSIVYERGIFFCPKFGYFFLSKMEILTELGPELGAEPPRIYNFVECPPPTFTPSSGEEKEECYRQRTLEQRP